MAKKMYIGVPNLTLPSGYTQVEYIESTGTQYIDTGISVPHASEKVVVEFAPTDVEYDNVLTGHSAPEWSWATNLTFILNARLWVANTGIGLKEMVIDTFYKFEYTSTYYKLDDSESYPLTALATSGYTDGYNSTLFYSSTKYGKYKVKSYKLYNGSTLVRDLIPCVNQNGVVGMYDLVNSKFYTNAGTGSFIAGSSKPDNVAREVKKFYIGSSGVARRVEKGYIGVNGVARQFWAGGIPLGEIAVGSTVKLNVNGTPMGFIVVNQGIPSNSSLYDSSCNGTWLLMEGTYQSRTLGFSSGRHHYDSSALHERLNNTFIPMLDQNVQSTIKQVKIPYCKNNSVYSGTNGLSTKAFAPSLWEMGFAKESGIEAVVDGAVLEYFSGASNDKRICYRNGTAINWWTRSGHTTNTSYAFAITTSGKSSITSCSNASWDRPVIILPFETLVPKNGLITCD